MPEPTNLKYAKTHEWVRLEGEFATVGISQHAQEELGDVALVLLPEVGRMVQRGEKFGEIESIKAVSDLYAPISGEVTAVNETLTEAPEKVNDAPYGDGWMLKIKMSQPADADLLLDSTDYETLL
jgi:glycine cleavage system H protein